MLALPFPCCVVVQQLLNGAAVLQGLLCFGMPTLQS